MSLASPQTYPSGSRALGFDGRALGFAACALASGFWGCGFFFGKIALAEMNVGAMVFYRFAFGLLGLTPMLFTHRPHLSAREWRLLLLASFLGIPLQFLLQFYGLSLTTVSHASLMVGTMPVLLAVGATLFAGERLPTLGWAALLASTAGAALIVFGGHRGAAAGHGGPSLSGDLLVVASMVIALFWILGNQRLLANHSPITISAYGLLAGTLMLAVIVPPFWGLPPVHGISAKAWLALVGSGLLCTASTSLLWNWGLTRVPASQAGVLLNIEPLVGSVLGVALLGDHLGRWAYLGGCTILLAALVLTTRSGTAAGTAASAAADEMALF